MKRNSLMSRLSPPTSQHLHLHLHGHNSNDHSTSSGPLNCCFSRHEMFFLGRGGEGRTPQYPPHPKYTLPCPPSYAGMPCARACLALPDRAPDLPLCDTAYRGWSIQGCRVRQRQPVLFVYLQGMKAKLGKDFGTVQPSDYKVLL